MDKRFTINKPWRLRWTSGSVRGLGAVIGAALAVTPTHAWALADNAMISVSLGFAIPLLAALVWSGFLLRQLRACREALSASEARTNVILEASPNGCLYWRHGVEHQLSGSVRGFEFVGLKRDVSHGDPFEIITQRFDPKDRLYLMAALTSLRETGTPFDGTFHTIDARVLELAGRQEGRDCVLWIADATSQADLSAALCAKTRTAADLQTMLDLLPLAVWWRDASLQIVGCNTRYAAALDATKERVIDKNWEIVPERRESGLARRAQMAGAAMSESAYIVINGERRLFEFSEAPLSTQAGETSDDNSQQRRVGGYAMDVTALETVQSDLAEQIAAHDSVLESLGTAIAIFGQDKRLQFFNNAFLDLWGLRPEHLSEEPLLGDVLEILRARRQLPEYADFAEFKREMNSLFTSLIEPSEELIHLPDERTLRMLVTPHPTRGLMFVYEDVTDRLALERSYNTLIAVQKESLNNLHEAIAVFGADGRLKLWNDATTVMWSVQDEGALLETHISDLLEETRSYFMTTSDWPAQKQRLILSITEPESREGRLERTDGSILDYKCVPLPDGGCLLGYIDVTDGFRVQRALEDRNAALEQADRMKSEFIATMSHELRTPLNAIIGFTEILDNQFFGELEPRQKEYVQGILAASRHLLSLINDILDLASVESGIMTMEMEPVDVKAMLNDLVDVFQKRAVPDDAPLEIDCPADIGEISADLRRLRQALYNLVSNALQFTPPDGKVNISAWREDDDMLFCISDSGVDIAPEDHDRIFEKFERTSRGGRQGGAGLGLALVKSIVELHGGEVVVSSGQGRGTQITCRVPSSGVSSAIVAPSTLISSDEHKPL